MPSPLQVRPSRAPASSSVLRSGYLRRNGREASKGKADRKDHRMNGDVIHARRGRSQRAAAVIEKE